MNDLSGKTALVTGASAGMGMATVAALADMGAHVVMLCRSEARGRAAYETLMSEKSRSLTLMLCDLGDLASVREFAAGFHEAYPRLDILINNAGFISLDRQTTVDGFERQFGVNHLGHFALTLSLLDMIPAGGRIVVVASGAHKAGRIHWDDVGLTHGYHVVKAYGQSKLANVLFTRELSRRLTPHGVTVNCCHPGAVATSMGVDRKTGFGKTITGLLRPFFLTPAQGADTAIWLATSAEAADVSGEYFYKRRPARSSKASQDTAAAERLFTLSEELTGQIYPKLSTI